MLSQLSIEIEYVILFLSIKIGVGNRNRCVQSKLRQKGAKEIEVTVNASMICSFVCKCQLRSSV